MSKPLFPTRLAKVPEEAFTSSGAFDYCPEISALERRVRIIKRRQKFKLAGTILCGILPCSIIGGWGVQAGFNLVMRGFFDAPLGPVAKIAAFGAGALTLIGAALLSTDIGGEREQLRQLDASWNVLKQYKDNPRKSAAVRPELRDAVLVLEKIATQFCPPVPQA